MTQIYNLRAFCARQQIPETHATISVWRAISNLIPGGAWLAGGAVTALLSNTENLNDYDVFFKDETSMMQLKNNFDNMEEIQLITTTDNSFLYQYSGNLINVIRKRYYPDVDALLNDFDITACMFAIDTLPFNGMHLFCGDFSLLDLANKEIKVHNVESIGTTFKRIIKYGTKGFIIPLDTYEKLGEVFGGSSSKAKLFAGVKPKIQSGDS